MTDPRSDRSGADVRSAGPVAVELTDVQQVFRTSRNNGASVIALQDITLTVGAGEFISLIGPSGCGKSTLLRVIAGLLVPTGGRVAVNGKSAEQARLDQDYGFAFQQAGLLDWRNVRSNVELPLQLHGVGRTRRKARAMELLDLVGLADFADARPAQLSGGMQQRVAIARALAEQPALLLMDEPFGALDEMTRERMQSELVRIARETSAAVVFVTHSIPEAVFLADRVVVMSPRPGRIAHLIPIEFGAGPTDSGTGRGSRDETTREAPEFFAAITAVREALRGRGADAAGRRLGHEAAL